MIISIDYDHTYTADPELWRQFIRSCQFRKHPSAKQTAFEPTQSATGYVNDSWLVSNQI